MHKLQCFQLAGIFDHIKLVFEHFGEKKIEFQPKSVLLHWVITVDVVVDFLD